MTALLDTSTASLGATRWWSNGIDGAGPWDVGVLDTGMDLTNPGLSAVPSQSGVFLAVDPANQNHPFRFNATQFNTFKNGPPGAGLLKWIDDEKTAP